MLDCCIPIIVQPYTKRVHHYALYEDVGCEIFEDLFQCGLILGIKQPKVLNIFQKKEKFDLLLEVMVI